MRSREQLRPVAQAFGEFGELDRLLGPHASGADVKRNAVLDDLGYARQDGFPSLKCLGDEGVHAIGD